MFRIAERHAKEKKYLTSCGNALNRPNIGPSELKVI